MGTQLCENCGIELDKNLMCPQCGRIYSQPVSFGYRPFEDTIDNNSPFDAIPLEETSAAFANDNQNIFNRDTTNIEQEKWNEWVNQNINITGLNPTHNPSEKKKISGHTIAAVVLFCIIIVQLIILIVINKNKFKITSSTIETVYASTETQFIEEEELNKWVL